MAAFGGKRALGMIVCTRNVLRRLFSRLRDSNACLAEMRGINGHAARCRTGDSPPLSAAGLAFAISAALPNDKSATTPVSSSWIFIIKSVVYLNLNRVLTTV
jgi:hypothetical protein